MPPPSRTAHYRARRPGHHSYARLDADLTDPAPFTVRQLGPRRLWDETFAAYDWRYVHG
ncbi:hypothetical protein [Amycolatopsis magusensis]|uniref:hypothetical protein n=1 Tax=Amycolatopsis magusensis TaxID=882444 RepID=UPI0037A4A07D